tara:strand:+ start:179 stop:541 length:363 start_codon:yes stop_codon:yes gene_type:complete
MNDHNCIICFEELSECKLNCCNKVVHEKCIKDWWSRSNPNICPHCRQNVKLIDNVIVVENCFFGKELPHQINSLNEIRNYPIPTNTNIVQSEDRKAIVHIIMILFGLFIIMLIIIIITIK